MGAKDELTTGHFTLVDNHHRLILMTISWGIVLYEKRPLVICLVF
jgi:hypothetical protein